MTALEILSPSSAGEPPRRPAPLRFTVEDQDRAHEEWGSNCGPGAIAAVLGMTLDELRPHLFEFEEKRYTNPTLMWAVLRGLGIAFHVKQRGLIQRPSFPFFGLARIQWEGPWTAPGVPARAAYRHSHWVGACDCGESRPVGIFDVNAMDSGGWVAADDWAGKLVPWLLEQCEPKASGKWYITHSVEVWGRS